MLNIGISIKGAMQGDPSLGWTSVLMLEIACTTVHIVKTTNEPGPRGGGGGVL